MNDKEKLEAIKKTIDEIWNDHLQPLREEVQDDPNSFEHLLPLPKALLWIKKILEFQKSSNSSKSSSKQRNYLNDKSLLDYFERQIRKILES